MGEKESIRFRKAVTVQEEYPVKVLNSCEKRMFDSGSRQNNGT